MELHLKSKTKDFFIRLLFYVSIFQIVLLPCMSYDKRDGVGKEKKLVTLQNSSTLLQVTIVTKLSEHKIVCQSNGFPVSEIRFQSVFCQDESECMLKQSCFDEREVKTQACSETLESNSCPDSNDSACLTLPQRESNGISLQGMIQCSAGAEFYQSNYFVGFDKILYLDWKTAPDSALVEISSPNQHMSRGESYPFVCKVSKLLSGEKLVWAIEQKNGSEIELREEQVQDVKKINATELEYQLYTIRESLIHLDNPIDFDLICKVPMSNTEGWKSFKKRITFKETPSEKRSAVIAIVVGSVTTGILLLLIIGVVVVNKRRPGDTSPQHDDKANLTQHQFFELLEWRPDDLNLQLHLDTLPYNKEFEIPLENLSIDFERFLGGGQFGTVYGGSVKGFAGTVAVKTINTDRELYRKGFLRELKVMIYIGEHPNIIKLIGASTDSIHDNTIYIVTEFCEKGSLENHLRSCKPSFINQIIDDDINPAISQMEGFPSYVNTTALKTTDLVKWSHQISNGMEFLAMKRVVHADLAARNILVDGKDDVKITDFGLSRKLYDLTEYVKKQQEPLPWQWMAVESLQQLKFTSQSDVWSFGILLWEIFSLGDVPYPGLAWRLDFVQQLKGGLRMTQPVYCNTELYNLMLVCWEDIPEQRPSFGEISQYFKNLLDSLASEQKMEVQESSAGCTQNPIYFGIGQLSWV